MYLDPELRRKIPAYNIIGSSSAIRLTQVPYFTHSRRTAPDGTSHLSASTDLRWAVITAKAANQQLRLT